ncbi:hypothetical protein [Glaciibacter superstes]|uniref:hypothetical protein n=1 Tax=Glaciibacter superstes TaxID=501023 RepID=UPI0003B6CE8E|nr:hypothetical protein [Glaciibacter superstes]
MGDNTTKALNTTLALLLGLLIVTVAVSIVVPEATLVAGALTLASALTGLLLIPRTQRLVAVILLFVGVSALILASILGHSARPAELLSLNQDLISMLAAVSFIQLITISAETSASRLSGRMAVWRTAAAVHLLGAVINVSALNIIGDHLGRRGRLSIPNTLLLSRAFSAGAFWSPFWAAAAAAIAYAPGAKVNVLIIAGGCLALAAMVYSISGVVRAFGPDLADYHGYVLSWRVLRVPLVLVAVVLIAHGVLPQLPIPNVVLVSSLGMTIGVLLVRQFRTAPTIMFRHLFQVLPRMKGEVTLFASAGVLAVGLGAYFSVIDFTLPLSEFTVGFAWLCTLGMTMLSLVGVHPVISIAAVATLIAPMDPDPSLYAMASMIAWGASAAAGPISGLNIYLNGRFGTDSFALMRRNLPYLGVVMILAWPVLQLCATLA